MAKKPVVTRFAPSPTGALHIGGARTALFNWLYARANGGKFLLRIEDTDKERSRLKHRLGILEGLAWLGLDWDDKPIRQRLRTTQHRNIALQMLEEGTAYKCFSTQKEIDAHSEKNPKEPFISPWRDVSPKEHPDAPYAIRLYVPQNDIVSVEDKVQKPTTWKASEFNDLVLLRSDGTPTYMLAVVVDDHDMGVTHVIRGDDHFINAGKQTLIYRAMGWDCPTFAHIPLIHGEDGKKLSKRHGATDLLDYAKEGYMPEAMRNALTRLGWSHRDDELFTSKQAMKLFDLSGIKKSPSQFNKKKLDHINAHHIKTSTNGDLFDALIAYRHVNRRSRKINTKGIPIEYEYDLKKSLRIAIPSLRDRGRNLSITWDTLQVRMTPREVILNNWIKNTRKRSILEELTLALRDANWDNDDLLQKVKDFAEKKEIELKEITDIMRTALVSNEANRSVFNTMRILKRKKSLMRLSNSAKKPPINK